MKEERKTELDPDPSRRLYIAAKGINTGGLSY